MKRGAQLIDKYIRQGLSPEERYELEKLALDDTLLAEAWEGLSAPYATDNLAASKRLDKRLLDVPATEAKVVPLHKKLWPYAVAASLALVMAIGVLLRQDIATPEVAGFAADQTIEADRSDASAPVAMVKESAPAEINAVNTEVSNDVSDQIASSRTSTTKVFQEKARVASAEVSGKEIEVEKFDEVVSKTSVVSTDLVAKPEFTAARRIFVSDDQVEDYSPAVASAKAEKDKNLTVGAPSANGASATHQEIDYNTTAISISSEELATQMDMPVATIDESKNEASTRTKEFEKSSEDAIVLSSEELATQMDMPVTIINDTMKEESTKKTKEFKKKQKPIIVPSDNIAEQIPMPSTPIEPVMEVAPTVGFEKYDKLLNDQVEIGKDEFFMRSIKESLPVSVQFKLDEKGMPKDVSFVKDPVLTEELKQQIIRAFETVSPWQNVPAGKLLSYTLKLRAD